METYMDSIQFTFLAKRSMDFDIMNARYVHPAIAKANNSEQ